MVRRALPICLSPGWVLHLGGLLKPFFWHAHVCVSVNTSTQAPGESEMAFFVEEPSEIYVAGCGFSHAFCQKDGKAGCQCGPPCTLPIVAPTDQLVTKKLSRDVKKICVDYCFHAMHVAVSAYAHNTAHAMHDREHTGGRMVTVIIECVHQQERGPSL